MTRHELPPGTTRWGEGVLWPRNGAVTQLGGDRCRRAPVDVARFASPLVVQLATCLAEQTPSAALTPALGNIPSHGQTRGRKNPLPRLRRLTTPRLGGAES